MTTHPDPRSFDCAGADAATVASETTGTNLPDTLPATTPPDARLPHDGWTPERQAAFLRELAARHNVTAAARAVGMSRQSAYKLRTRLQGQPFDKAWDAAFLTRFDVLAEAALDRALNGVEVPHYYNGELIGSSRRYDERLTLALLALRKEAPRTAPGKHHPAHAFECDEIGALTERVKRGPENWLDTETDELDARFGASDDASDARDLRGSPEQE